MTVAFLVDGDMEKKIIQRLCPGAPIRLIGSNGKSVKIDTMCRFISAQLKLLINRYWPIVILFDREDRSEDCDTLRSQIFENLSKNGFNVDQIVVGIADRCTETWIIPFLDGELNIQDNPINGCCDGDHGKVEIKKITKKLNRSYVETVDGVGLFCKINPHKLKSISPSFRELYENMTNICIWMRL